MLVCSSRLLTTPSPYPAYQPVLRRVAGRPGIAVLHWLYHLLLQPASQLESLLSPSKAAAESGSTDGAEAAVRWQLHVARSRAAAAYYLLAAAIVQQQVEVVEWLLGRLRKMTVAGSWVEASLVAQQSLAWEDTPAGQQVPLLVLTAVSGNKVRCLLWHAAGTHFTLHACRQADRSGVCEVTQADDQSQLSELQRTTVVCHAFQARCIRETSLCCLAGPGGLERRTQPAQNQSLGWRHN